LIDMVLANELDYEINYGFHALIFATKQTITNIAASSGNNHVEVGRYMSTFGHQLCLVLVRDESGEGEKGEDMGGNSFYRVASSNDLSMLGKVEWLDGRTTDVLGEKEILLPYQYKNMLQMNEAEITLSEAQVAALAAIYGEDVWNEADPENDTVNFAERMQRAAVISYIKDSLANVSGLQTHIEQDIQNNGYSMTAYEYWMMKWNENGGDFNYIYPHLLGVDTYYVVRDSWREKAEIKAFVEQFLGVEFPDGTQQSTIANLAQNILDKYYGGDLTHKFRYDDFSWALREVYIMPEVLQKQPWNNEKMVALLIEKAFWEIDSETVWNSKTPAEKQSAMSSFYTSYYVQYDEYEEYYTKEGYIDPTYTVEDVEDLCRGMLMHASGMTQADLLAQWKLNFVERNNENNTDSTLSGFEGYTVAGFFSSSRYSDLFVCDSFYNYAETWVKDKEAEMGFENNWKEEIAEHEEGIWGFAIAPMPNDEETIRKLAAMHYAEEGYGLDVKFEMNNAVMATLGQFDDIIEVISQVFVWVGLALAVFSSFLLMNFISTSISYKKREIGILRAVGARSSDVFKIFFSEAFIIAIINFVLATAASLTTVLILNNYMRNQGINITLLSFGIVQVLIMLGISVLVAAIASFLPVYKIAHKKPVDAIKDR